MDSGLTESERAVLPLVLAERLRGLSPQFGKTVLMKLAYLLQEVYKVPLGYRFTLYTYGPYSTEVLADLDKAKSRGWVEVNFVEDYTGYRISIGPQAGHVGSRQGKFVEYEQQLDQLIETFGKLRAKDLELRTTIAYMSNYVRSSGEVIAKQLAESVHQMKPHFTQTEIEDTVEELRKKGIFV